MKKTELGITGELISCIGLGTMYFGTQLLLTPEQQRYCKSAAVTMMAYSPLLGGAYIRKNNPLPPEYHSRINEDKRKRLNEIAEELNVSANAISEPEKYS